MRCAVPTSYWAFTSSSGSALIEVQGLAVSAEGVTCTGSQYVVLTQSELDQATVSPFRLTAAEGGLVSAAILGTWATAFVVVALIRAIRGGDPET